MLGGREEWRTGGCKGGVGETGQSAKSWYIPRKVQTDSATGNGLLCAAWMEWTWERATANYTHNLGPSSHSVGRLEKEGRLGRREVQELRTKEGSGGNGEESAMEWMEG